MLGSQIPILEVCLHKKTRGISHTERVQFVLYIELAPQAIFRQALRSRGENVAAAATKSFGGSCTLALAVVRTAKNNRKGVVDMLNQNEGKQKRGMAKIGLFGKAIIAAACVAVIVGGVYLVYGQMHKRGGAFAADGGIPNGVYVHGSAAGGIKLTFSGNTLITTFMQDGDEYPFEGTYEIKGDGVILITDPDGDTSESEYSLNGPILTIDGMDYIDEKASPDQISAAQNAIPDVEEEPALPNDPLEGTYIRQGTEGLFSLTFSGNEVTLVTSGFKNMGMTVADRTVKGTYTIAGDYLTFDWEEWQGQNVIIHTAAYSSRGNVLIYDLLEYHRR